MPLRKRTDLIVIHCSATPPDMDIGAAEIRGWHKQKGWSDIGYHFVIRRNGEIENGRDVKEIGSHVAGHNWNTVSICMVGGIDDAAHAECNFTPAQWAALKETVHGLCKLFGRLPLRGHHDLYPGKDCPSFNVKDWARENGFRY